MIVNQEREKTAQQIAGILNNCEMLLGLDIEKRVDKYSLFIKTDQLSVEYKEFTKDGMEWLLSKLKDYVVNKDDIDELLEEIDFI
ncbi:hypothetical protein [Robertmurraya siralis]|uniref:hypothetical protein n=1 Tax=Robertmurraya siralis TaxID=77777 RepID=UPI0010F67A3B|nr:hypothetical protein [Robertmurraya siralis]